MAVVWSDLQTQLSDYIRSYTTGSIDQGNKDRALNRAVEYFQRRLSLPSDRRIYSFYFTSDTLYYTMPAGFNEAIGLYYHTQSNNTPDRAWVFRPDLDIIPISGLNLSSHYWGFSTINQALQIALLGSNIMNGTTIENFDAIGNWVASGDASALAVDSSTKHDGTASLSFLLTYGTGTGTLTNPLPTGQTYDFSSYHTNNAKFKVYVYLPASVPTNVKLIFGSNSSTAYYTGTATTQDDGSAFTANAWNKVGFFFNDMVITGSPTDTAINFFTFQFTIPNTFITATARIDNFFVVVPDQMDLVYFSSYKGYTTGVTPKVDILNFNAINSNQNVADSLYFGDYAPDLISPICKKAALELIPQLRQSPEWYSAYKAEVEEYVKIFGKIFPRKRTMNYGKTKLNRTDVS